MELEVWMQQIEEKVGEPLAMIAKRTDERGVFPKRFVETVLADTYFQSLLAHIDRYDDFLRFNQLIRHLSKTAATLSSILFVQAVYGVYPLIRFATDRQLDQYKDELVAGRQLAAFAHSEQESGSDILRIRTQAKQTTKGWILNGAKYIVANGNEAKLFYVSARTTSDEVDAQYGLFIVPRLTTGLIISDPVHCDGIRGMSLVRIEFRDVFIQAAGLLGEVQQGKRQISEIIHYFKVPVISQAIGLVDRSLQQGLYYLKLERKIGHRLIDLEANQEKIIRLVAKFDVLKVYYNTILSKGFSGYDEISLLKLLISEFAVEATEEVIQLVGGYSYMNDNELERIARDGKAIRLYGGSSKSQIQYLMAHRIDPKV